MSSKRKWSDFTPGQQGAILVLAAVELGLTTAAVVDLVRRPAEQIHGPKAAWALGVFVQPVGPVAYLLWGRTAGAARQAA